MSLAPRVGRLERVQQKTKAQIERYSGYRSAGQVRQEFQDDMTSEAADKVNADLKKLGLPAQPDVAEEFFALADRIGVTAERMETRPHKPHPPHPWHKKKPEDREKAKRDLMRMAREGDQEALETLRTAPASPGIHLGVAISVKALPAPTAQPVASLPGTEP